MAECAGEQACLGCGSRIQSEPWDSSFFPPISYNTEEVISHREAAQDGREDEASQGEIPPLLLRRRRRRQVSRLLVLRVACH